MSIDTLTGEIPGDEPAPSLLERAQMRADVAEGDLRLAEDEIRTLRRSLGALKAELNRRTQESPHGKMARLVADYYAQRLKRNKSWKFGEKRQKAVLARLKEEYEPLYICRAIDGLAAGAHTDRDSGVRYDDLELVCRNEVNLERFHQLAEKNTVDTLLTGEWRAALTGTAHLTDPPDHPTK